VTIVIFTLLTFLHQNQMQLCITEEEKCYHARRTFASYFSLNGFFGSICIKHPSTNICCFLIYQMNSANSNSVSYIAVIHQWWILLCKVIGHCEIYIKKLCRGGSNVFDSDTKRFNETYQERFAYAWSRR